MTDPIGASRPRPAPIPAVVTYEAGFLRLQYPLTGVEIPMRGPERPQGVLNEDLIRGLILRITVQDSLEPSQHNASALYSLRQALESLQLREQNRSLEEWWKQNGPANLGVGQVEAAHGGE